MRRRELATLIAAAALVAACRTGPLELVDGGAVAVDELYDAHLLTTDVTRIGVFKRSTTRDVCAWIILAQSRDSPHAITTPAGWIAESASINTDVADCFTVTSPFGPAFWPAEGTGAITFGTLAGAVPCSLAVHATIAADKTVNGSPTPPGISPSERFDVETLWVDGTCAK